MGQFVLCRHIFTCDCSQRIITLPSICSLQAVQNYSLNLFTAATQDLQLAQGTLNAANQKSTTATAYIDDTFKIRDGTTGPLPVDTSVNLLGKQKFQPSRCFEFSKGGVELIHWHIVIRPINHGLYCLVHFHDFFVADFNVVCYLHFSYQGVSGPAWELLI